MGATENGTVVASRERASKSMPIEVTVTPDEGYKLASLTAMAEGGDEIQISNGKFTMPDDDVTIIAAFEKIPEPEPEPEPGPQPEPTDEEPESPNTLDDLQTNVGIMAASVGGIVVALLIKPRKKKSYLL